ncbi:MAG: hypothetical protein L3J52_09045 [Proteobacteria bacterium]|nr:hypothetical protein [Pseudomonadota bacterium]
MSIKTYLKYLTICTGIYITGTLFAETNHPYIPDNEFKQQIENYQLATIRFSNGNEINFVALPQSDEIAVEELLDTGPNEIFILEQLNGSLLDKYLQITPENTPVPQSLIDLDLGQVRDIFTDKDQLNDGATPSNTTFDEATEEQRIHLESIMIKLGERQIVSQLKQDVFIQLEDLSEKLGINTKAAAPGGQGSCNNSTGYLFFQNNHCNTSGNKGTGSSESDCDFPMHNSIQRTSSSTRRTTYSRVANCGGGDVAIVHSKKILGSFSTQLTWFLAVNRVGNYESWAGKYSIAKKRRVNVLKVTPGGYVRGWTRFHKNVK